MLKRIYFFSALGVFFVALIVSSIMIIGGVSERFRNNNPDIFIDINFVGDYFMHYVYYANNPKDILNNNVSSLFYGTSKTLKFVAKKGQKFYIYCSNKPNSENDKETNYCGFAASGDVEIIGKNVKYEAIQVDGMNGYVISVTVT